jgi:predicted DNA-binding antitoxin AbrB/MazE fold protein
MKGWEQSGYDAAKCKIIGYTRVRWATPHQRGIDDGTEQNAGRSGGQNTMVKQVKVRYRRGVLELLEPLEIEEGAELTVMLSTPEATPTAAYTETLLNIDAPQLALSILSLGELYEGFSRARDPAAAERAVMTKRQSMQLDLLVKDAENAIKAKG